MSNASILVSAPRRVRGPMDGYVNRLACAIGALLGVCASVAVAQPVQWRVQDGGNGHYYDVKQPTFDTWTAARDAAAALSYGGVQGHLVTIGSAAENDFVGALAVSRIGVFQHGNVYIGLFQDTTAPDFSEPAGGWRWCTGEPVTFLGWGPGHPENSAGIQNFAYLTPRPQAGASDWDDWGPGTCCTPAAYVVEYGVDNAPPPLACATWANTTPVGGMPPERFLFSLAYDQTRSQAVMFGGQSPVGDAGLSDTWTFNGSVWTQRAVSGPGARVGAPAAYDAVRQRVVLFGGTSVNAQGDRFFYGDTWEWDGSAWNLRATAGPPARYNGKMVYDSLRNRTVIAGGSVYTPSCGCWVSLSDTWEWDGTAWTQGPNLPEGLSGLAMAYDPIRGQTVVFGGGSQFGGMSPRTYVRTGVNWAQAASSGPSGRENMEMVFMPSLGGLVLFGGTVGNPDGEVGDTWFWNGTTWQQINTSPAPGRRESHGMYLDTATQRVVMVFGRLVNTNTTLDEMWSFSVGAPLIVTQPASGLVATNRNRSFFVVASGGGTLAYQWRKNGVPLANGGPISGVNGQVLTIMHAQPDDEGGYDCIVSSECGGVTSDIAYLSVVGTCESVDFNGDGSVNPDDLGDYITAYFTAQGLCP